MPLTEIAVKEYTALITQTGTAAPIPIILLNTIGTIIWTRTSAGLYVGTKTGAFPEEQTYTGFTDNSLISYTIKVNWMSLNEISILTLLTDGEVPTDEILYNTPIRIQVYNI